MAHPRRDSIAADLRTGILQGRWAPGDRLPAERDLATRLGAHRSSVREALRTLEQQGLVEIKIGSGARVREIEHASLEIARDLLFLDGVPNQPMLEQLLDVHELLVVGATRLAVEHAGPEQVAEARELLARLAAPTTGADEFIDTVDALLGLIVEASGNLVLQLARRAVNPLFDERFRAVRRRFRPGGELVGPIVDALLRAVERRDAPAAEDAVRRLLRENRSRALEALQHLDPDSAPPSGERQ